MGKVYEFNKKEDVGTRKKKIALKKYNNSNLIYSSKFSFYKYHNIKKFDQLSFKTKYSDLAEFSYDLNQKLKKKTQK